MSLEQTGRILLRKQAVRLAELLAREGSPHRAALVGRRWTGKSAFLRQVYDLLFQKAEGPFPFCYVVEAGTGEASGARHFVAAFCQQVRTFLLRQEELLDEPPAPLEKELERPGLPLSLAELGRDFLSLPEGNLWDFAAALPAQFAHRERRPVCLLLDDLDACGAESPLFTCLSKPYLACLLAGRSPFLRRAAGRQGWTLSPLEPFSSEEALAIAERTCREFDVGFSHKAWEAWFDVAGTAPGWVRSLTEAAALAGVVPDSVEALARFYARELLAGSLGNWLAFRWERAVPDRDERARVGQHLARLNDREMSKGDARFPVALWEGLIAEEWAEETASGPVVQLGMAEQDWLDLVRPGQEGGTQQAQARVVQAFLHRAGRARQWRQASEALKGVRAGLLQLPESGFAGVVPARGELARLPSICSVAAEQETEGELFWCYGFYGDRLDYPEASCLLLIALCYQEPLPKTVSTWSRRLEEEAKRLPQASIPAPPSSAGPGPRSELWVAVPPGVSLKKVAGERRMRWETLTQVLREREGLEGVQAGAARIEPGDHGEVRLRELEARARWLEEELSAAREQFLKEVNESEPETSPPTELGPFLSSATPGEGEDLYWRMATSLSLLLVSTDLLAVELQSNPAKLGAVRDLQLQCQRLLKVLRGMEKGSPPEKRRRPRGPSSP